MKHAIVALSLFVPRLALACPACASAQRGGPTLLHLVLVVLPFLVAAVAARAIYGALRDDD